MRTLPDLVSIFGVPERTLRRWVADDRLCHVVRDDHGRIALLDAAEVDQLVGLRARTGRLPKGPRDGPTPAPRVD